MQSVVSVKKPTVCAMPQFPIRLGVIFVNLWSLAYRARGAGAGEIGFEGVQGLLVEPALDYLLHTGGRVQRDDAITQRPRSGFNGDVDDCWEDLLRSVGGNVVRRGNSVSGLLHDGEGL